MLSIVYLILALILTIIPSNPGNRQPEKGITIYLKSNGVHTDLVLPLENKFYNWQEHIYLEDFGLTSSKNQWIAFGWGDKGFYLNTPEWSDLTISTALDAIIPFVGKSAMHVTLYEKEPVVRERVRKVILSEEQYARLTYYIYRSFSKTSEEEFILLSGYHYHGIQDNFYEAEGDYNLVNTCNNWANSALKAVGVRTAFWAPFDKCVFYHF
jgi:uncharacterized protein (TIGR02117 family)